MNDDKYLNLSLNPIDEVEHGQIETHYQHLSESGANNYRLVTNWVCAYDGSGCLITSHLYRNRTDFKGEEHFALQREEIETAGQAARQYAVKIHSELVAKYLVM